ncbi:MAG TPA: hypothetical protein VFQ53_07500 [Kofleriaceae bacterium]|nr:hypothetical protein [Kofleriaceae bacterium]
MSAATQRPKIAADVAATLTAQIPARLVKKLDADPTIAERWTWAAGTITTDKGETVRFTLVDEIITEVGCSCLLGPKCLHVAAVVAVLEPAEGSAAPAATVEVVEVEAAPAAPAVDNAADAIAAAQRSFRALADVLGAGAEATGTFAQAEVLRAIHACKTAGLHRLAQTQTRALRSIRELRADKPEFALEVLTADLREGLVVAHLLAAGELAPELVGRARRDYEPIGNIRLRGVLTEAVVARSGYAGAITYLVDDKGQLYTRADVAPGDVGRAAGAYDGAANIGDAVLPHRELCRTGLFVSGATASADGRLGAGQKVKAVKASEPSRWDGEHLAPRFREPLADQLARIAARDGEPEELRPAGWDLAFVEGIVVGGPAGVGMVAQGDVLVRFTTALEHKTLAARDNLGVLAKASGLHVRAIGRVRVGSPRQLELLAIGPAPDETRLALPDAWHGRANIHYDRLSIPPLGDVPRIQVAPAPPTDDLLSVLRRRVERCVLGGAGTLPTHAIAELEREAATLTERALRGGADVLLDLAALAHDAARSATGARKPIDRATFARAWLRAALYEDAARRRLSVASW